jgi:hypothetical protein
LVPSRIMQVSTSRARYREANVDYPAASARSSGGPPLSGNEITRNSLVTVFQIAAGTPDSYSDARHRGNLGNVG